MPVLLYHGDNILEIDDAVRSLRQRFQPADVLTFEGTEFALAALSEACLTAGLFDPERLVIVHNLHERMKGSRSKDGGSAAQRSAETEEITAILGNVPPTTTLVLAGKGMTADHQLAREVRQVEGEVRAFMTPRKGDLPRWVMARGKQHGVRVDVAAAELLADQIGANPLMLESELEKLSTYAGQEERITPAMVEALVGTVTQDSIFTLVDAIAGGDRGQALRLLRAQRDHSTSTATDFALYLIRMLARQVRILLRIRLGREAGRSPGQITADLKLPRYYADRYFRQANRLSKKQLIASFEDLAALEQALKTGRGDPATSLDLLVTGLCA